MLQEPEDIAVKRKRTKETLRVLRQAMETLDNLPQEAEAVEKGYGGVDTTGLPRIHGLPTSSMFSSSSSSGEYTPSRNLKGRKQSHPGELQTPFHTVSNGTGRRHMAAYPILDD